MTQPEPELGAMTVVGALMAWELTRQAISYFFKKLTKDDYITKSAHEGCQKQGDEELKKLTQMVSTMRGILLVMAVKEGIPAEQLQKLTE